MLPEGGNARGNPLRPTEHITGTLVVASSFRPGSPSEADAYHESLAVVSTGDAVHFISDSAEMGCDVRSPGTL